MDYASIGNLLAPGASIAGIASSPIRPEDAERYEALFNIGRVPQDAENGPEFLRFLCRQLEAVSINVLFQAARRTVPDVGLFSGGFAGEMYQGLADEEYSRLIADRGGFGLGDALFRQIAGRAAYTREAERSASDAQAQSAAAQDVASAKSTETSIVAPQGAPGGSDNKK